MHFPLSVPDLSLWIAATAIILLITSELISSYSENLANLAIEKSRLRLVALLLGMAFVIIVLWRAVTQP